MYDFTPQEILKATERLYIRNQVYKFDCEYQLKMIDKLFHMEAHRMLNKMTDPVGATYSTECSVTNPKSLKNEHRFSGSVLYYDKDGTVKKTYIKRVIYSNPATIVFFGDGTKTICKAAKGDVYNPAAGLAFCVYKKMIGASALVDVFNDWVPMACEAHQEGKTYDLSLKDIRKKKK